MTIRVWSQLGWAWISVSTMNNAVHWSKTSWGSTVCSRSLEETLQSVRTPTPGPGFAPGWAPSSWADTVNVETDSARCHAYKNLCTTFRIETTHYFLGKWRFDRMPCALRRLLFEGREEAILCLSPWKITLDNKSVSQKPQQNTPLLQTGNRFFWMSGTVWILSSQSDIELPQQAQHTSRAFGASASALGVGSWVGGSFRCRLLFASTSHAVVVSACYLRITLL